MAVLHFHSYFRPLPAKRKNELLQSGFHLPMNGEDCSVFMAVERKILLPCARQRTSRCSTPASLGSMPYLAAIVILTGPMHVGAFSVRCVKARVKNKLSEKDQ